MQTTIRRLGNSAGVILPAAMMRSLKLETGQEVTLTEENGCIIIAPAIKDRNDDPKALNLAINYALDCAAGDADKFLRIWREGDVDKLNAAYPNFIQYCNK